MGVILSKDQKIDLPQGLTSVKLGLAWKGVPNVVTKTIGVIGSLFGKKDVTEEVYTSVDVDSFVYVLDNAGNIIDTIYYSHRRDNFGAIYHHGDDLTGKDKHGKIDNEEIDIDLNKFPKNVAGVIFGCNVFTSNYRFHEIDGLFTRIVDRNNDEEIARYNLGKEFRGNTCLVMGAVMRTDHGWEYKTIGQGTNHGSIADLRNYLARQYK